jgi:hypothetical protein
VCVQKHSVDVVVGLGGDILNKELDLVDEVATLGGGGGLSALSIERSNSSRGSSWLNLGDVEAGSEGVGAGAWGVEEVIHGGSWKVLMLLVDFGEDNWGHGHTLVKGGLLSLGLVVNLGEGSSELGGRDVGHNVGVVLENKNVLVGGLIVGGRSDSNNGSLSEVWEFKLEDWGEENITGGISELNFVGVFVELEDLEDLSVDIEITFLLGGLVKGNNSITSSRVFLEVLVSELSELDEDGGIGSLDGGSLSGESEWLVSSLSLTEWVGLISGEKSI